MDARLSVDGILGLAEGEGTSPSGGVTDDEIILIDHMDCEMRLERIPEEHQQIDLALGNAGTDLLGRRRAARRERK